jgi:hypothetical protein
MNTSSLILIFGLLFAVAVFATDDYITARESVSSPPTDIYFPTCIGANGECLSPLPADQRFPAVIFLQGGSVDASAYSTVASKLAAKGFIVAVPNAPRTVFFGVPVQLTTPQIAVAAKLTLRTANASPSSGIFDRLQDDAFSLVGHSFGGVIAMIASANDAAQQCAVFPLRSLCFGYTGFGGGLKAVVTWGASLVDRGRTGGGITIFNLNTTGIPTVLVHGKNDGKNLLVDDQTTYDACLETPKALIELDHANHFGITDAQVIPGASVDTNPQTKSQDWSTSQIAHIFSIALNAHVNNEANALDKIYVRNDLGPNFITVLAAQLE